MQDSYDCIVIGGGPAGSTVAALVAESKAATLLVERERMPRFHVGESLMPESYWTFQRLGVLEKLRRSDFVRKVSVQFVSHRGNESQPFYFQDHDPRECSATWQVERADFDKLLFDNAAEKGADCVDGTRVLDVIFDGQRATGVQLECPDGTQRTVHARVLVDATGQQALLANRLRLRDEDPQLKKAAIWCYYQGARRDRGDDGGATVILHTAAKQSWFWYIPLRQDITSIGVVADHHYLLKGRGKPAEIFAEELAQCQNLVQRLRRATLVSNHHVAKEFSYKTTQHAGDGWVLVGDAFGFIDPIYSSGVFFALKSGELAADCIIEALRRGDTSAEQLNQWTEPFKDGAHWIRKLVSAFYTHDFSFGHFLREHPEHQGNLTDLLIGRIFYEGAGKLFDDMDPALVEAQLQGGGVAGSPEA